jgi:hypothetical protein
MDGVQRGIHAEADLGLRRINRKRSLLRLRDIGRECCGQNQQSNMTKNAEI